MKFKNILIIKTGHFETFIEDKGTIVSLGDVLRTTALLRHLSEEENITWITSSAAKPLLPNQKNLAVLNFEDELDYKKLFSQATDVINLERHQKLVPRLIENKNIVTGYVPGGGNWILQDHQAQNFSLKQWNEICERDGQYSWNARLFRLLGLKQNLMTPIFAKPNVSLTADIGLNWKPGSKWPSKDLGQKTWEKVETELSGRFRVSWQQGFDSITQYAQWIASNRLLITIDSLGLHLALAMGIPVVAVFGPTNPLHVDKHEGASFLSLMDTQTGKNCSPCYLEKCDQPVHCSDNFPLKTIKSEIDRLLGT